MQFEEDIQAILSRTTSDMIPGVNCQVAIHNLKRPLAYLQFKVQWAKDVHDTVWQFGTAASNTWGCVGHPRCPGGKGLHTAPTCVSLRGGSAAADSLGNVRARP